MVCDPGTDVLCIGCKCFHGAATFYFTILYYDLWDIRGKLRAGGDKISRGVAAEGDDAFVGSDLFHCNWLFSILRCHVAKGELKIWLPAMGYQK